MLEDTTIHNAITDKALASYFRSSGNLLEEESAVLGQAVTNLMLSGDNVNNKNIILAAKQAAKIYKEQVIFSKLM